LEGNLGRETESIKVLIKELREKATGYQKLREKGVALGVLHTRAVSTTTEWIQLKNMVCTIEGMLPTAILDKSAS
jgi:hypothetical protein